MRYSLKIHPSAYKFIKKLPKHIRNRVLSKIRLLSEDPFRYLEHFEGQDYYKLRVGEYRALIDVDSKQHIVFVQVIDHRKRIYKRT